MIALGNASAARTNDVFYNILQCVERHYDCTLGMWSLVLQHAERPNAIAATELCAIARGCEDGCRDGPPPIVERRLAVARNRALCFGSALRLTPASSITVHEDMVS